MRGKSLGTITDHSEISTNEIPEVFPNITDHKIPDFECSLVEWEITMQTNGGKQRKSKGIIYAGMLYLHSCTRVPLRPTGGYKCPCPLRWAAVFEAAGYLLFVISMCT